ncbi:hypothetical protein ACLKA6_014857 [Drosophila palustris]
MKLIFVGLFVTFLAVQECRAQLLLGPNLRARLERMHQLMDNEDHYQVPSDEVEVHLISESKEDSAEDSEKPLAEKIEKLNQKVDNFEDKFFKYDQITNKLEENYEELRKTVAEIRAREVPKFEKIGSKYYYIDDVDAVNWFDAAHKCRAMGANLAGLQSQADLSAVSEKLTHDHYWLDINDLAEEGVFKLLSTGKESTYLNWHYPEPNNKNVENCVELLKLDSLYAMNDNHCEYKFSFICEKDTLE